MRGSAFPYGTRAIQILNIVIINIINMQTSDFRILKVINSTNGHSFFGYNLPRQKDHLK